MKPQTFRAGAHKNSSSQGASPLLTIGNASIFPRHVVGTLALVTCGILVAVARPNGAQNAPPTAKGPAPVARAAGKINRSVRTAQTPGATATTPTVETTGEAPVIGDDGRRPIEFYTQTVRGGLFNAPEPPQPRPVVAQEEKTVAPTKPIIDKPIPINPFDGWIYTGTMTSGGQTTALIENLQTKEGRFIKLGETMLGARADVVDDNHVIFKAGKTQYELGKSMNMSMTPLDRSAIPTTSQQPQQPQIPGQPQAIIIAPSATGPTFSLPNGRQLTPDQMQRRMQRMNQNFNQ